MHRGPQVVWVWAGLWLTEASHGTALGTAPPAAVPPGWLPSISTPGLARAPCCCLQRHALQLGLDGRGGAQAPAPGLCGQGAGFCCRAAGFAQLHSLKWGRTHESQNKRILCLCLPAPGHENATPWAGTLRERQARGDVKPHHASPSTMLRNLQEQGVKPMMLTGMFWDVLCHSAWQLAQNSRQSKCHLVLWWAMPNEFLSIGVFC